MLVKEIKPIGKVGKNLLIIENTDKLIEHIIEIPLQKACKLCKEKNIETVMSSCNKRNIVKEEKRVNKKEVISKLLKNNMLSFTEAGKGYAWLMINYNTLSDENKEILYFLEKKLDENTIWFVKTNYFEVMNKIRKCFKLKELNENVEDKYEEEFKKRSIMLMYNNNYPTRAVFIRMKINEDTRVREVEDYFDNIIKQLSNQIK